MQALKFTLSGNTAFFKRPDVNSYVYFTYSHIHKVALLGIFGAICGLKGYAQQKERNEKCDKKDKKSAETIQPIDYPEFYSKLKNVKIAIIPQKSVFNMKFQKFNNSVGYASKEEGGNLIVTEQWLENPNWDIYVLSDCEEANEIQRRILEKEFVYIPYLGKNDHYANITDTEVVDLESVSSCEKIHSMIENKNVEKFVEDDDWDNTEETFLYKESLPVALEKEANQYILSKFVYTNEMLKLNDFKNVYSTNGKNLYFF